MTIGFLVIVGSLGIGIEQCWKRLFKRQGNSWKSKFVESLEVLFKESTRSSDLEYFVSWYDRGLGPSLVLERQLAWLPPPHVGLPYGTLTRSSTCSLHLPGSSRRFLSN